MTKKSNDTIARLRLELTSPPGEEPWMSLALGMGLTAGAICEALRKGERTGDVIAPAGRHMGAWTITEEEPGKPVRTGTARSGEATAQIAVEISNLLTQYGVIPRGGFAPTLQRIERIIQNVIEEAHGGSERG